MIRTGAARWRSGWVALVVTSLSRGLLLLVATLAVVTLVPAALGWWPTVAMSGSMAPAVEVGDVVVSRPVARTDLRFGQIVLVDDADRSGSLLLHRLVRATDDGRLVLRGDRNAQNDSAEIDMQALHGVAALRVPMIGTPFVWAQQGEFGALGALAAVVVLLCAGCFVFRRQSTGTRAAPPSPKRHPGRGSGGRGRPRTTAAIGGAAALALVVAGGTPADAAAFSATTVNAANAYASAARFKCSDRFAADSPVDWWKLAESGGTTAADQLSSRPGTYTSSGVSYREAGPCPADTDTAVALSGAANVGVTTSAGVDPSTLSSFTEEIAFKTTTTAGGLLMGLWASPTSPTGVRDRVIAMSTSGQLVFGMLDTTTGTSVRAASSAAYNDGAWHVAAAVYSGGGMRLYVDGTSVGTASSVTANTAQTMYWRIGFGDVNSAGWIPGGSSTPAAAFAGSLADAVVYATALSSTRVTNHYQAFAGAQNYAEGEPASQSSNVASSPASKAVDGNTDGIFNDGSVTHTSTDPNSWWQVDLQHVITATQVRIWNRTDCCGTRLSDYWVFLSVTPFDTTLTPAQQAAQSGVWATHQTTAPSPSTTITPPAGTRTRYVMVQEQTSNQNLSLAEVQVYGTAPAPTPMYYSQGITASQSSDYSGGVASRGTDGNTDGNFVNGSVTHTAADAHSWWQADLGTVEPLGSVAVWNRMDCCSTRLSDFWVFVSSTPFNTALAPTDQANQSGVVSAHLTTMPNPKTIVTLPNGTTGRYVMVQEQTSNQSLSLAEVQIFGP